MAPWAHRYVGLPAAERGREPSTGLDCWGLVRLVLAREAGIDAPSWEEAYSGFCSVDDARVLIESVHAGWEEIDVTRGDPLQSFDVLLFNGLRSALHVGVAVDGETFLHVDPFVTLTAAVERWRGPKWESRMRGVYRSRTLSA
jgi:cell wall-associated NlpC family hydrolase